MSGGQEKCAAHGKVGHRCTIPGESAPKPAPVLETRRVMMDRITYLAVGLSDVGLRSLVSLAEGEARRHPRDLSTGALAAAQQEREASPMGYAPGCACAPGAMCRPCRTEQAAPMAGKVCVPERGGL